MDISLPDSVKSFVDNQVGTRGYSTSSECVRELIRRDRGRRQGQSTLRRLTPSTASRLRSTSVISLSESSVKGPLPSRARSRVRGWSTMTWKSTCNPPRARMTTRRGSASRRTRLVSGSVGYLDGRAAAFSEFQCLVIKRQGFLDEGSGFVGVDHGSRAGQSSKKSFTTAIVQELLQYHFRREHGDRLPYRVRADAVFQQIDRGGDGLSAARRPELLEQRARRRDILASLAPVRREVGGDQSIHLPVMVHQVSMARRGGIVPPVLHREGQRADQGLGQQPVSPQRAVQPVRVGGGYGLVADGAEVAGGMEHEHLQRGAGLATGNRGVARRDPPHRDPSRATRP